jgi:hypothetical protein
MIMVQLIARGLLVLAAASALVAPAAFAADDQDVVGTWKLSYDPGDGPHESTLNVSKADSGLKAEFVEGGRKLDVKDLKFEAGTLRFLVETEHNGEPASVFFEGKVEADAIAGDGEWEYQGMTGTFPFSGKREPAGP